MDTTLLTALADIAPLVGQWLGIGVPAVVGIVILFVYLFRFLRSSMRNEGSSELEYAAKTKIIDNLVSEVERMQGEFASLRDTYKKDITELRELHEVERKELMARIKELEERLETMKQKHENIRSEALSLYDMLSTSPEYKDTSCLEELKSRLMNIILHNDKGVV